MGVRRERDREGLRIMWQFCRPGFSYGVSLVVSGGWPGRCLPTRRVVNPVPRAIRYVAAFRILVLRLIE